MSKLAASLVFLLFLVNSLFAQDSYLDTLRIEVSNAKNDTTRLILLISMARNYVESNPDSAYRYAELALPIARKMHLKIDESGAIREMGYALLNSRSNSPMALKMILSAIENLEDPGIERSVLVGKFPNDDALMYRTAPPNLQRLNGLAFAHQMLGVLYANANNYEKSLHHHLIGRENADKSGNVPMRSILNLTLNRVYLNLKKTDSALLCIQQSYDQVMQSGYTRYLGSVLLNMGHTYLALGNIPLANEYYRKCLVASKEYGYQRGLNAGHLALADYYYKSGNNDSAFWHIENALSVAQQLNLPAVLQRSYRRLTRHYRSIGNNDSAVKYQELIININDTLFSEKLIQEFQNIDYNAAQQQQEIIDAKKEYQNRIQKFLMLGGLGIFSIVALVLYRNNKQKQQANQALEKTLQNLKSAQSQLVQSEKMASLGELCTGIAHEIQNPLNFVNNFSEINKDLLQELKQELTNGNIREGNELINVIEANEEKVTFHGKRADAIVKGMLQHSRSSIGIKESTNINALADEYLRLAYHGLRAKDTAFNATMQTDFDANSGSISIVPQDIGRVMVNLFNNAFYAVNEKSKQGIAGYEPTVTVSTRKEGDKVLIVVKDNGPGIPESIKEKIFQPFFTTKPTGQGTGLGLSLSYDIVTKGHDGELTVDSSEGNGVSFTIKLPIQ